MSSLSDDGNGLAVSFFCAAIIIPSVVCEAGWVCWTVNSGVSRCEFPGVDSLSSDGFGLAANCFKTRNFCGELKLSLLLALGLSLAVVFCVVIDLPEKKLLNQSLVV